MKKDSSRDTFKASKHYSRVLMQQGRVQVDADWNEQGDIIGHRVETADYDTIGQCGAPIHDSGFHIVADLTQLTAEETANPANGAVPSGFALPDFLISAGRMYVDGILCENEILTSYTRQPDLPAATAITDPGLYVVYLDVWQRHITALDDPSIREVALGGPDTATRAKTIWQVKQWFAGAETTGTCLTPFEGLQELMASPTGKLTAGTKQAAGSTNPCIVPPGAGYRGLENQLYRVEVHDGGGALDVTTAPAPLPVTRVANHPNQVQFSSGSWQVDQVIEIVSTASDAHVMNGTLAVITAVDSGTSRLTLNINVSDIDIDQLHARPVGAAYKWSRDNGSVATAVLNINGAEITVHDLGPDAVLGFSEGQWVEYSDDVRELNGQPGVLARIIQIDRAINLITLNVEPPPLVTSGGVPDLSAHPKLRAWHGVGPIKFHPGGAPENDLELENGVVVRFSAGSYRSGDYWTIPARTATADAQSGNIQWPVDASGDALALSPFGIEHHYCRLAMLHWNGQQFDVVEDCRKLFPPLTELMTLVYVSGDGQESRPFHPIPQLLQAGVFNGRWPVPGERVRFRAQGNGRLAATVAGLPASVSNEIIVTTGADGIASCAWQLEAVIGANGRPATPSQQVEARLLDADGNDTPAVLRYNGNLSVASEVFYAGGNCQSLAEIDNVQDAISVIARLASLYEVSGNNQVVTPGTALQPLVVVASSLCGPVAGMTVQFAVTAGNGTLSATQVNTQANGTASTQWTPDDTTPRQEVEATLLDSTGRATVPPTRVRFTASLNLARQEPGIHIVRVTTTADDDELRNDSVIDVRRLAKGITFRCDRDVVPTSVGPAPDPVNFRERTPDKPTCYVTIDLPFPHFTDFERWRARNVVGFQEIKLSAQTEAGGPIIQWTMHTEANRWIEDPLFTHMADITDRFLLRLTLKGNFIFAGNQNEQRFLDGDSFGRPGGNNRTDVILPSGDTRRGGDFEMWFWIARREGTGGPLIDVNGANGRVRGTLRVEGAVVPGVLITLRSNLVSSTFPPRNATTDAAGNFTFPAVPPGTYTVTATASGVSVSQPVTVT